MATLNITKFDGGFSIDGTRKRYIFQPYYLSEEDPSVNNETLTNSAAFVGTDRGVVFLDTTCTINNTTYKGITDFLSSLYGNKSTN